MHVYGVSCILYLIINIQKSCLCVRSVIQTFKFKEIGFFRDKLVDKDLINEYRSKGRIQCVEHCLSSSTYACTSIAFNEVSSLCRHFSITSEIQSLNIIPATGWNFFSIAGCPLDKGFTYNKQVDMCYLMINGTRSYTDSVTLCRDTYDAKLPILNTAEKINLMVAEMDKFATLDGTYLGATRPGNDWIWDNGEPFTTTYWGNSQPNKRPNEVFVACSRMHQFHWHDYFHNGLITGTVCEFRGD